MEALRDDDRIAAAIVVCRISTEYVSRRAELLVTVEAIRHDDGDDGHGFDPRLDHFWRVAR